MSYFISIAYRWEQNPEITDLIEANRDRIASGHKEVAPCNQHCTLFAVAKIASESEAALEKIRELFAKIPRSGVEEILRRHLAGKTVTPYQWNHYPDNTTIQFKTDANLSRMRTELRELLGPALELEYQLPEDPLPEVESLLTDRNKSQGEKLFGSVARNQGVPQADLSCVNLPIGKVEVTISNDDLSNRRESEKDYFVVPIAEPSGDHSS